MGLTRKLKRLVRRDRPAPSPAATDAYLPNVTGVIHIGAHTGQESDQYLQHQLDVLWIEANPNLMPSLQKTIRSRPQQQAICYLVSDRDVETVDFHVADNNGASSSIFQIADHEKIWPKVGISHMVQLASHTLPSIMKTEMINIDRFQCLSLDTQGSELKILKGAEQILERFLFIKVEAADFNSYQGGCTLSEIQDFLNSRGFAEIARHRFAHMPEVGSYFDVLFQNKS